jgi:hypothetical protein
MKNAHYNEMVRLLMDNPEGLRIRKIARYIYNGEVNLFDLDAGAKFRKIHSSVARFLWTQSRRKRSPFERRGWGKYALKPKFVVQLELTFDDWDDEDLDTERLRQPKRSEAAESLMNDLFAGMF